MSDVKIGNLFMELGLDVDQVKINDVVNSLGKLNFNSVLGAIGVGALVDGLKEIMTVGQQLTEPLYRFNKETGLSAQRLAQWTEFAHKAGVQGDVVEQSLGGLQKKMAAIQFGDTSLLSGIYLLQQAGAKITQQDLNDPFTFLSKATEGLQRIKPELRTYVAGLLGLNEQILLLKSFNGADVMPAPTTDQINKIRDYTASWTQFGIIAKQVITDIAAEFAPSLEYLGNVGTKVFNSLHQDSSQLKLGLEEWVGIISLALGPWTQLGFVIAEIAIHLKDIVGTSKKAFSGAGGLLNNYLTGAQNNILAPIGLAPYIGNDGSKHVTQHNAITIIAHNIEDLEHKVSAFFEKTIAKSFYQNSRNY